MKLYICKSMKQYQFLRSKKIFPEMKVRTLDKNQNLDGRPASIFIVTDELSAALVEWSGQYGGEIRG